MTGNDIALIHADDALLVLDKPAGLLAVPGRGADKADCLATRVQAHYPEALIVHRLDMATSGIMLMARGAAHQRSLSIAFAERRVAKRYQAWVAGQPPTRDGAGAGPVDGDGDSDWSTIDLPLACDWPNRPKQKVDIAGGRPSVTRYRVLRSGADATLLELEPVTGRSHQLRVHLHAVGLPILGDRLYAPLDVQQMAPRLMLHATRLALAHPLGGEPMRFDCPPQGAEWCGARIGVRNETEGHG